ncbi:MAG TPA: hypothetical protein VMA83_03395 [Solirubrobacteraceae bacterium]|nr:hypothetical protein [Solirubrobacteraceae bacterium]
MRSIALESALTTFVEAAAGQLQRDVLAGAEIPFDLEQGARSGPGGAALARYRPLTDAFIAERAGELAALDAHAAALAPLADFDGLQAYLAATATRPAPGSQGAASAALLALLCDVFEEQSDFQLHESRLRAALERLDHAAVEGAGALTFVATLRGMSIASAELAVAPGARVARPEAIAGLPEGAREAGAEPHLVIVLSTDGDVAAARQAVFDLLRALRLFGDGRVCIGQLAWCRYGAGAWTPVALGAGGRPRGTLLATADQEQELREFCELVGRRAPKEGRAAWAMRRFELGCERERAGEALTDHLLALRVLLEPEGPATGLLAPRLAVLCAGREERGALAARVGEAIALERSVIDGAAVDRAAALALADEMSAQLRALLRDIVCGHLDADVAALADELLAEEAGGDGATGGEGQPPAGEEFYDGYVDDAGAPFLAARALDSVPRP